MYILILSLPFLLLRNFRHYNLITNLLLIHFLKSNMLFHMLDGPEDRVKLREKLKGVINDSGLLVNGEVKSVYFGRFILQ